MVGSGAVVFAVWGYVVANTKPPGVVELNARILSSVLGCSVDEIEKALKHLCSPDPRSRGQECDGRRLVEVGPYLFEVPRWSHYRNLRNDEERRAYNREAQVRHREKVKMSMTVIDKSALSAKAEAEAEAEAERSKTLFADANGVWEEFWKAYPRKTAKQAALKAWKKVKVTDLPALMVSLEDHKGSEQWQRGIIPHPATWLNGRRWEDEVGPGNDLGQCMWNRDGTRDSSRGRCELPGVEERDRVIYCKAHKHLHLERMR